MDVIEVVLVEGKILIKILACAGVFAVGEVIGDMGEVAQPSQ